LGLGHAIWCAKDIVGDEPFAVLLADDMILSDVPVLTQMVGQFERLRSSMVAVIEVEPSETDKYGIIDAERDVDHILRINSLIEKPKPAQAPSNLAIIGRYILTPKIFDILGRKTKGAGGEIQLTDAMSILLKEQPIFAYKFKGTRYDCGDKAGFQKANIAFALERPELREQLMPYLHSLCETNGL
jgi:UTP--glucose-1-phosphate uridylyltransferase